MIEKRVSSQDYLHICRGLHIRVTEMRYGRTQDLGNIEDRMAGVRLGHRLTYEDIERIRDSKIWNANAFGYWPGRDEVESLLAAGDWNFSDLPRGESGIIECLFGIFRQIEPVSVVLRFIVPEHYGILSPPVERLLGIGSLRKHPKRYRTYLKSLRKIKEDRRFRTVADTEMALWALQLGILDGNLKDRLPANEYNALRQGFLQDVKLREIRVGNLTQQIFSDLTRVQIAEALLATNVELAGQIAGIEFERAVRSVVEDLADLDKPLHYLERKYLDPDGRYDEARKIRNRAIHLNPKPKKREVEELIEAVKRVTLTGMDRKR